MDTHTPPLRKSGRRRAALPKRFRNCASPGSASSGTGTPVSARDTASPASQQYSAGQNRDDSSLIDSTPLGEDHPNSSGHAERQQPRIRLRLSSRKPSAGQEPQEAFENLTINSNSPSKSAGPFPGPATGTVRNPFSAPIHIPSAADSIKKGHRALQQHLKSCTLSSHESCKVQGVAVEAAVMASRPRAGRGTAGRDSTKDVDVEADLLARVIEGLKKCKEANDRQRELGTEIMILEQEMKTDGPTLEQHKKLDQLYRENLKAADAEKKILEEYDLANNIAIYQSLTTPDEPPARNGTTAKGSRGKPARTSNEAEVVIDSPGPSPSESRDVLKRVKGTGQRSTSVASTARSAAPRLEEAPDNNRGLIAEKAGQLVIGTEVFYKLPKGTPEEEGAGIQCIIKKIYHEKKPIAYDIQDPVPDASGKTNTHKAFARDLIPIPAANATLPTFSVGANVFARYPETDTFYKAKVRGFHKGLYTLKFEGEEDDKEMDVDKRFVLDSRLR